MTRELFTIIDFETTGLDAATEQITELAALKIDEEGNEYGSLHTFIKLTNGREPSPYAKVTKEECGFGVNEDEAFNMLKLFIQDTTVIAQYAPFDFSYLDVHDIHPESFICTRALTHMIEPHENPSLGPTVERLGVPPLDAHRAMDDVKMTKEVFLIQKERIDVNSVRNKVVDFKKRPLRWTPVGAEIIKEQ